jgi:hypothetical protein
LFKKAVRKTFQPAFAAPGVAPVGWSVPVWKKAAVILLAALPGPDVLAQAADGATAR